MNRESAGIARAEPAGGGDGVTLEGPPSPSDFVTFVIPGDPVPFARAGAQGKRRFTPMKQSNYMQSVRFIAGIAMGGRALLEGAVELWVIAQYTVPASWPKKRQASATWRTSIPDWDNIGKLISDSCNGIIWLDDAQVCRATVEKRYGARSQIEVRVRSL